MSFTNGRRNILLAHQFVTGAERSESEENVGGLDNVDASVFERFDYVALGHIHKPQDVTDTIRYSGTPMPFSFGREEKQQKSVTLIDTQTMERRLVPLPLLHRRTTITGTLEEVLHPACDDEVKNGYVRAVVTDIIHSSGK